MSACTSSVAEGHVAAPAQQGIEAGFERGRDPRLNRQIAGGRVSGEVGQHAADRAEVGRVLFELAVVERRHADDLREVEAKGQAR